MKQSIYINDRQWQLDSSQLIQSGGEGMVFQINDGNRFQAVKIYHRTSSQQADKLQHLVKSGLIQRLPAGVLGPRQLVTDKNQKVIGFTMNMLPPGSQPVKILSNPIFRQKTKYPTIKIIGLFLHIHNILTKLHKDSIIVGDLNDQNLFFHQEPSASFCPDWIDVDSYQIGQYPCPVAMQPFLDPLLYHVTDFGQRPYFSEITDWYAFAVLLFKSLVYVHPYGGTHNRFKTLQARATARVSIQNAAVTLPNSAQPVDSLSDDLLNHFHRLFDLGERLIFPAHILAAYAKNLIDCPQCDLSYPVSRSRCPSCKAKSITPHLRRPTSTPRLLFKTEGFIEQASIIENGRILLIVYQHSRYKLIQLGIGGVLTEMNLFDGRPNYRFGIFSHPLSGPYIVVNPPRSNQLLILDVSGLQPKQVALMETAYFRETAVFATTPKYLYRIAGNWIMRGLVRNGMYLEDGIATAHQRQTRFWGSPCSDVIAGYHRIFAENRFFLIQNQAEYEIPIPLLIRGDSLIDTAVKFEPQNVFISQTLNHLGQQRREHFSVNLRGTITGHQVESKIEENVSTAVILNHPQGRLLIEPSRLSLHR